MKRILTYFYALFLISINSGNVKAQLENLTFDVRATNFTYYDDYTYPDPGITGQWNVMEFDIFIQQTNIPANDSEIMRFGLGQYYININFGGLNSADTVGGYASYSYLPFSTTFENSNAVPTGAKCVAIAATTDQGAFWPDYSTGIRGGYLNLNPNVSVGGSYSDVQISGVYPGTKVGRFRLKKNITSASPSPFFPSVYKHLRWRVGPAVSLLNANPVSKIYCYNGLGGIPSEVTTKGTWIMDTLTIVPPPLERPLSLNIKVLMEGLYNPMLNQMVRKNEVAIFLRKSESPYEVVGVSVNNIDSIDFTGLFQFNVIPDHSYYIVANVSNKCIETWSKIGGEVFTGRTGNYNFTNSISKAFGNNLKLIGSNYCIYTGDVTSDGVIDSQDISLIEELINWEGGETFLYFDLDRDDILDATEISLIENNIGINEISPFTNVIEP